MRADTPPTTTATPTPTTMPIHHRIAGDVVVTGHIVAVDHPLVTAVVEEEEADIRRRTEEDLPRTLPVDRESIRETERSPDRRSIVVRTEGEGSGHREGNRPILSLKIMRMRQTVMCCAGSTRIRESAVTDKSVNGSIWTGKRDSTFPPFI